MEKNYNKGLVAAIACSSIWGFLPIYWRLLVPIPSSVIIFYRIFLVGVVSFIVALKLYGFKRIKEPLKNRQNRLLFFLAGVIITANWSIYIWAVNAGHIIQTSIGYYMQPLVVCLIGIIFFKEKVTKYNLISFAFAIIGVIILLVHFGEAPLIALSLALTFAVYAALKKFFNIEAILSLFYETMFLMPGALIVIIYLECTGQGALAYGQPYQYGLLMLAGVATAVPLGLFAVAATNLPLITLGVTEYISPSIALLLGIFLYREPFDMVQFISFIVIWIGLIIFTIGEIKSVNRDK